MRTLEGDESVSQGICIERGGGQKRLVAAAAVAIAIVAATIFSHARSGGGFEASRAGSGANDGDMAWHLTGRGAVVASGISAPLLRADGLLPYQLGRRGCPFCSWLWANSLLTVALSNYRGR